MVDVLFQWRQLKTYLLLLWTLSTLDELTCFSVAFHIEASHMICSPNGNAGLNLIDLVLSVNLELIFLQTGLLLLIPRRVLGMLFSASFFFLCENATTIPRRAVEQIDIILLSLLLNWDRFHTWYFYCWLWGSKYGLLKYFHSSMILQTRWKQWILKGPLSK